jgi:hypothetical protein
VVLEFLVVTKEASVVAMKGLPAERVLVGSKIKIRVEQCVKRDLTKREVRDRRVPSGFGTAVDARVQSAQRCFELVPDYRQPGLA